MRPKQAAERNALIHECFAGAKAHLLAGLHAQKTDARAIKEWMFREHNLQNYIVTLGQVARGDAMHGQKVIAAKKKKAQQV